MTDPKTDSPMASATPDQIFTDFPPISTEAWRAKIVKDLKITDAQPDAVYQQKMVWRTPEGFDVQPLYRAEDRQDLAHLRAVAPGAVPLLRGNRSAGNVWEIRQDIDDRQPDVANRRALEALAGGADSVGFVCELRDERVRGVALGDAATLARVLQGIWLNAAPVHFTAGRAAPAIFSHFADLVRQRTDLDPATVRGSVDCDPLAVLTQSGRLDVADALKKTAAVVRRARAELPGVRTVAVSGAPYHNAGAGIVEELAYVLAGGNEMLTRLSEHGVDVGDSADSLHFDFSIGANYFFEIARLRAMRLLWARIVDGHAAGRAEVSRRAYIQAHSSRFTKTVYDPHGNLLRTTTEAMSAILGAADTVRCLPYDALYEPGEDLAERMARNIQHVLKHEAYLDRVLDPAAGSYYIEALTDRLARAAWDLFREIEGAGGLLATLRAGTLQNHLAQRAAEKRAAVASRRAFVLGTNQYPNVADRMRARLRPDSDWSAASGELLRDAFALENADTTAAPLPEFRAAEDFEHLRLATEAWMASRNSTVAPRVFLLTAGDLTMRRARAMFIANFFGCAGYESLDNPGFDTPEAGARAAHESGAEIVVFCGADAEYADFVPPAIRELRRLEGTPRARVVLAGLPKDGVDALKNAGVQDFVHARSNVLDTLTEFQKILGVMR